MNKQIFLLSRVRFPSLVRVLGLTDSNKKPLVGNLAAEPTQDSLLPPEIEIQEATGHVLAEDLVIEDQEKQNVEPSVFWNVDWLCRHGSRIFAHGWLIRSGTGVKKIELSIGADETADRIPVHHGVYRPDVKDVHPIDGADYSGFWLYGNLQTSDETSLFLEVEYLNGEIEKLRVDTQRFTNNATYRFGRWGAEYPSEVRDFFSALADCQVSNKELTVIFDHDLGGGANFYRNNIINDRCAEGNATLLIYPTVSELCFRAEYRDNDTSLNLPFYSLHSLEEILSELVIDEIFVNNLYSYNNPLQMVEFISALTSRVSPKLTVAVHDYFAVCPSYKLLDNEGSFCGIPPVKQCHDCLAEHNGPFTTFVDHSEILTWRKAWKRCLHKANAILCYSEAARELLLKGHPDLNSKQIKVIPHTVDYIPANIPRLEPNDSLNIGVVGAINYAKGSQLVSDLAELAGKYDYPVRITVIGTLDGGANSDAIKITGPYDVNELARIIELEGVNVFLFPSIWPETFSYVTEELINLEVPLAVYDIGAPAERVANYQKGLVLTEFGVKYTLDSLLDFYWSVYGNDISKAVRPHGTIT